jgi:hypothetical protein
MNTGRAGLAGRVGRATLAGRAGWLLLSFASAAVLAQSNEVDFTAVSANVKEPGSPVRIRLNRWSTDEERSPMLAALTPAADAAAGGANATNATAASGRGAAGRGRGARGRGRGRGEAAAPQSPIAALTAAISRAPTVGYLWTTDVTGYSIKYAYHVPSPGGGERIVLATDRRLGAYSPAWDLAGPAPPTDYDFTLVEIRLDGKGSGEGKTSLTAKVVADSETHTLALDNYAATPAILEHVTR